MKTLLSSEMKWTGLQNNYLNTTPLSECTVSVRYLLRSLLLKSARLTYLKEHKKSQYSIMLMNGTLNSHLHEIDEQANKILEQTVKAFAEADGCDEELKAADQMKWVGLMNNYQHCAVEIIFKELIYI